jgi:hypothetical protein
MRKVIKCWEFIGVFIIFFVGASLHFIFEWTGYWPPAGLFAAVNESTWEHFKMGFWPGLFYALIEYPFIKRGTKNFLVAKFAGLFFMPVVTFILFYGYTIPTGQHFLIIDIIIFFLSVLAGQLVSYKILIRKEASPGLRTMAIVGLVLMVVAFSLLSYFPPKNFIFRHPDSDQYGILDDYSHHDHGNEHQDEEEHMHEDEHMHDEDHQHDEDHEDDHDHEHEHDEDHHHEEGDSD